MKALKIPYWATTIIIAVMMVFSAYSYLTQDTIKQAFHHLGYPDYFRVELAIAKLIGAAILIIPALPRVKEWAYAGFAITFISAFIAHTVSGDPMANRIMPLVFLILLIVSYISYNKVYYHIYNRNAI
jgi:uncharacterized membrane protein YphA (DoxX/SURF4 family)